MKCGVCGEKLMDTPEVRALAVAEAKELWGDPEEMFESPAYARVCDACWRRVPKRVMESLQEDWKRRKVD